jgi:hypothetical protein
MRYERDGVNPIQCLANVQTTCENDAAEKKGRGCACVRVRVRVREGSSSKVDGSACPAEAQTRAREGF